MDCPEARNSGTPSGPRPLQALRQRALDGLAEAVDRPAKMRGKLPRTAPKWTDCAV
ncbi:hypothetical protein CBM2586_A11616 [Cupriavidus phytorum]|uniref:Uncharacterized protein n=1 Tax=Cupriavidus taiwanensis TaxID=164546 RepID=A0A975WSS8_9BURK|nr:hypothetical protein CBM2586_A11616 [Cupriavidus taiwanensis]